MNNHLAIGSSLAISLIVMLTGCGTATLHEAWDSEIEPTVERPVPDFTGLTRECEEMEQAWAPEWIAFEIRVLELSNQRRAEGADCNTKGVFPPAGPLTWNRQLACAARAHSTDMAERDYMAHDSPEGESFGDRTYDTGYIYTYLGENLAAGMPTAEMAVEGWMGSDGHCANLMNDNFQELGVGYASNPDAFYSSYWTQVFGKAYEPRTGY